MKSRLNLFSIFLSMMIFIFSIFECNITVYASSGSHGGGGSSSDTRLDRKEWFEENENEDLREDKAIMVIGYLLSEAKCLSDGDFSTFMSNYFSMKDYMTSSHITISEDIDNNGTPGLVFDADLTSALKQALIEYAEETNGFELCTTVDYRLASPTAFSSSYAYSSFLNLVRESGVIALAQSSNNYFYACRPFHSSRPISLVKDMNFSDNYYCCFYDTEGWGKYFFQGYSFDTRYVDENGYSAFHTITSFDDGKAVSGSGGYAHVIGARIFKSYVTVDFSNSPKYSDFVIFSTDGRKLKVFNSLNALKNYTTGNRSVYFGSGFYNTPGEIKVSFDDLEKYIDGKYDKFFDDLKDLIGKETDNEDSLTEEDLEKLVDKILDKMDETGGNTGDNTGGNTGDNTGGNTGDNSGLLDGISGMIDSITSTLSGYYDAVLMYLQGILTDLDYIVMEMQDMTEEEATTKTDSVLSELKSTFSEVGDVMTKKFPFCIPWDLKQLFVTLNGGKDYSGEEAAMLLSDDGTEDYALTTPENPELPTFKGYTGSGKLVDVIVYSSPSSRASPPSGDSGIMLLAADGAGDDDTTGNDTAGADAGVYRSESGAPVFHIPFVLNSIGLNSALVIDMSPFDGVSDISRTLFLLIFIYQLILLSIRITEFLEGFIG